MTGATGIPASLLLACLLGSMLGLGWHALFGRRLWQLPLYWLGGVVGFLGGVGASAVVGRSLYRLGAVPLVEGALGALLLLALLWLLTTPSEPREAQRPRRQSRQHVERSNGKG